jgi:hypothetical protein
MERLGAQDLSMVLPDVTPSYKWRFPGLLGVAAQSRDLRLV